MVRLRVLEILEERSKTKYWLWKRCDGMSYQNFKAVINNETTKIAYSTLDRLSNALEIPVGDLFEQVNDDKK